MFVLPYQSITKLWITLKRFSKVILSPSFTNAALSIAITNPGLEHTNVNLKLR